MNQLTVKPSLMEATNLHKTKQKIVWWIYTNDIEGYKLMANFIPSNQNQN